MSSGRSACPAAITSYPRPWGLTAISTVTATISEIPAARRNATKMRGSAAGATILTVRCTGESLNARATSISRGSTPPTAARDRIMSGQKQA